MLKHEAVLEFYLDEETTPEIFARKVAIACAYQGAIRIGERVAAGGYVYEYTGNKLTSMEELRLGRGTKKFEIPVIEEIHMSAQKVT
jgi:hypothetical protein